MAIDEIKEAINKKDFVEGEFFEKTDDELADTIDELKSVVDKLNKKIGRKEDKE